MSPELLQLLAGVAGAFVGGLLLAWRASKRLPQLIHSTVAVITSAVSAVLKDDVRQAVRAEVAPLAEAVEHLEGRVIVLEERRRNRP